MINQYKQLRVNEMESKKKKIGKYLIKGQIAEGGMGAILRARHPTLKRDVILKKLTLRGNSAIVDRFKREAQLMLEFSHDNIVQVYDHFREGGSYYIVMEYINGISLADLVEKNRYIPNDLALLIYRETCKALHYAHMKGVIHRDIKPDNVLISKNGEVKLTDFGIARSKDCDEEALTCVGMTLGTPTYMSPEQIDDSSKVDLRTDIYSMGVMLYVMTTGKSPFPSNLVPQTINAIQKGNYVKPEKLNPKIETIIKSIIKKSMHCKINRRFNSVEKIIKITDKRLKRFKTSEEINTKIMEYAYDIKSERSKKTKKTIFSIMAKGFAVTLFFISMVATLLFYLYQKGYHYEYLYPDKFGSFQVAFNDHREFKNPDTVYKEIKIYQQNYRKYKEIKSIKISYDTILEKKYYRLQSNKIYLKPGNYKIMASFENQLYQKVFFLYPRTLQKKNSRNPEATIVEIFHKKISNLPVKLNYTIKDNENDITNNSKLYIYNARKWIDWTEFKKSGTPFVSGKAYYFKAICDNYKTKVEKIYIRPEQTFLNLQLEMNPLPGIIYFKASKDNLNVTINDNKYYFRESNKPEFQKYSIKIKKFTRYSFSPGIYNIKVGTVEGNSKTVQLNITSRSRTIVKIHVNKKDNSINFYKIMRGRYVSFN